MSWGGLFGKSDKAHGVSRIQGPTPLQQQRLKQISSLRLFHQRVAEVKRDSQYRVDFKIAGDDLSLLVFLPDEFPNAKPNVQVSPAVQHVWVDDNMNVIGCTALNNFYMHSDLGKVLKIIIQEFQDHPPNILTSQVSPSFSSRKDPAMYSVASSTFYAPLQNSSMSAERPLISVGSDNTLVPKPVLQPFGGNLQRSKIDDEISARLLTLNVSQLQELNDNPEALLNEIKNMSFISDLQAEREELFTINEESARQTLLLKPTIESSQTNLRQVYEKHIELKKEYDSLLQKQSEHKEIFSLENIITNLSISAMQAEESSEEVAETFLNGQLAIDDFLKQFLEMRKLCHLRKAKEEKARTNLKGV